MMSGAETATATSSSTINLQRGNSNSGGAGGGGPIVDATMQTQPPSRQAWQRQPSSKHIGTSSTNDTTAGTTTVDYAHHNNADSQTIISPPSSPSRSILRTTRSFSFGGGGPTAIVGANNLSPNKQQQQQLLVKQAQQDSQDPSQQPSLPLPSAFTLKPSTSMGYGSTTGGGSGGGGIMAPTTTTTKSPMPSNKSTFGGGGATTSTGTRVGFVRSTNDGGGMYGTNDDNNNINRGGGSNGTGNGNTSTISLNTTRATNKKSAQWQPQQLQPPRFTFQAHARVFFQGKNDTSERQLKPTHCTSSGTNVLDSHIYVCVDAKSETLNLYPYKADNGGSSDFDMKTPSVSFSNGTNGSSHHHHYHHDLSEIHQLSVPLIIDPPVQLKYFDAELMPHSSCDVGLYVRNDPTVLGTTTAGASTAHHGSFLKGPKSAGASAGGTETTGVGGAALEDVRRHVFRFEFRNDNVLQSYERIHKYNIAASKAAELSFHMGTMSSNINNATKNAFSSHDDVEASRQLERQKLKDACVHYLSVMQHMNKEVSRTARHFVKAANVVTISIPATYNPPPPSQQQLPPPPVPGTTGTFNTPTSSPLRPPNTRTQSATTPLASNVLRAAASSVGGASGGAVRQLYNTQQQSRSISSKPSAGGGSAMRSQKNLQTTNYDDEEQQGRQLLEFEGEYSSSDSELSA